MEERRARRIDLTVVQMPEDGGGSRPKPPKAGARSVRLEPNPASGNHQKAERPLTAKTVAQPFPSRATAATGPVARSQKAAAISSMSISRSTASGESGNALPAVSPTPS